MKTMLLLMLFPTLAYGTPAGKEFMRDYYRAQAECRAQKTRVGECLEQARSLANHALRAQGLDEMPAPKAVGCPPSRKAKK